MNVTQFDHLLKRVNLEDEAAVKQNMLKVIERYLDALVVQEPVVGTIDAPAIEVEAIKEEVPEIIEAMVAQAVEYVSPKENTEIIDPVTEEPSLPLETEEVAPTVEPVIEDKPEPVDIPLPEVEEPVATEEPAAAIEEAAAPVEEPVEQLIALDEEGTKYTTDTNTYVGEFGLVSTTKDEHMDMILKHGGIVFRDKRSFYLTLCMNETVVALAKTIKIKDFPEYVQEHLKNDGFLAVDVLSFGDITKRSRARYTDVTYTNLRLMEHDAEVVKTVLEFLETGILPEHIKEEEEEVAAPVQPVVEAVVEPVTEPVQEVEAEPAFDSEEEAYLVASFLLNTNFVQTFENQKTAILSQVYGISAAGGKARLFTKGGKGTVIIGINETSPLKDNNYVATILDYTLKTVENKVYAQFKFDANIAEEAAAPAAPAPVAEKPSIEVVGKQVLLPDFPLTNKISMTLLPMAQTMFNLESAKAMIGESVSLLVQQDEAGANRIALAYDVFAMAYAPNELTAGNMQDSRWLARITAVDLIENTSEQTKTLNLVFDRLEEVDAFPTEASEELIAPKDFVAIEETVYAARQQAIADKSKPVVTEPEPAAEAATEVAESVSVESMMHKEYQPEEAREVINPAAGKDYAQGYQELVRSQSKDMGGSIQEIRNQTQVTPTSRDEIAGVISQTLKETNIHTKTEQKQTIEVVGNLQDGAGNLSQTETVIHFVTGYSPEQWGKSVGKRVDLMSEMQFGNGPVASKTVTMIGKSGSPVARGEAPLTEALFLDGSQHSAQLLAVDGGMKLEQGYQVSLRLGSFTKVA